MVCFQKNFYVYDRFWAMTATIPCQHCHAPNAKFIKRMTNVDKFLCSKCDRVTYISIKNSPASKRSRSTMRVRQGLNGRIGFMCFNHQNKANRFLDALNHGGKFMELETDGFYHDLKFVLTDTDIMGRRNKLEMMRAGGVGRFFVYPHAARPDLVNDIYKEWAHVTAHFVVSQGHADIMERFGYSRPLVPVGWSLCPIRSFRPRDEPRKVLFAPIHPRCSQVDQDVNRETFKRLERLALAGDIELTVRFVRSLQESGLEKVEHPNIIYSVGYMNQDYSQIDSADVVIGHQTVAWIAVARGVPTVMMAEDMPTHIQVRNRPVQWVRSWEKYSDLLCYPLDILATKDTLGILQRAVSSDDEIADWRRRMIGYPFQRGKFLEKLERFL